MPLQTDQTNGHHDPGDRVLGLTGRVSHLEAGQDAMNRELGTLRRIVDDGFREIRTALNGSSRTNWGWIFSGVTVMTTMVVAILAGYIRPLEVSLGQNSASITRLDDTARRDLESMRKNQRDDRDTLIRLDERIKMIQDTHRTPLAQPGPR